MNNVMAGVWYDLREKQLWPVALGLLVAIVVVVLLLPNDTKEVAEEPTPTAVQQPAELKELVTLDSATVEDSNLEVFSVRDPFRSLADISATGSGGTDGSTGGAAGSGTSTTGTSTGTSTGSTGTGTTDTGGGGGTGATPPPPPPPAERREIFTFRVDMTFNREGGNPRRIRNIDALELIPDSDRPFLVFLGVTKSLRTAVFLVNDEFEVETEGRCEPSPATCNFLYLRTDSESDDAVLSRTDDAGNVTRYEFQLDDIERVLASRGTTGNTDNRQSPAFAGRKKAERKDEDGDGKPDPPPPFQPSFFNYGEE